MIYPERMQRVTIVGPKSRLPVVIDVLHRHAVLHIVDHRKGDLDVGAPLPGSAQLSERLIRVRSLLHSLGVPSDSLPPETLPSGDLAARISTIHERISAADAEEKKLRERRTSISKLRASPEQERDIATCDRGLEAIAAERARLRAEHGDFLLGAERILAMESRKAQTPLRFAVSQRAFLIDGWVPTKAYAALEDDLTRATANEIHLERVNSTEGAPVKLDNNQLVSPYELLLKLYTIPKYNELDPSFFIFLSFPLFFGFILGDIGYGIVLLAAAIGLRVWKRRSAGAVAMSNILVASSISTMIFGFVYGEIFGTGTLGPIHLTHFIHRAHDVMTLLYVSIGVGVVHITVALITGFFQEAKHHGGWKAFCAKASWLILLIGAGLLGAHAFADIGSSIIGWSLIGIAIALILIGEGARGLIEIPAILSNILSYARLMAVGVASAGLAIVTNELAGSLFASEGIFTIALGVLVLILGHLVNIVLGILGSFIHGLRLNYVEFFGKFYEGGGRPYRPFGTEDQEP